jgi:hypothetical protein
MQTLRRKITPTCGEHGLPSTAPADVSNRSIDSSVFRIEFERWERRNIGRCRLMMGWNRRGPGEAGIWRQ